MPRQRRRRDRRPNVFVQETAPRGREEIEDVDEIPPAAVDAAEPSAAGATAAAVSTGRSRRLRAQRAARQARVRSEVFTRSIGSELRKLGMISAVILVVLIVLTFTL